MSYDEMELDMIGDRKTAMFVIISDTDDTFNFVVAIMYTQLFNSPFFTRLFPRMVSAVKLMAEPTQAFYAGPVFSAKQIHLQFLCTCPPWAVPAPRPARRFFVEGTLRCMLIGGIIPGNRLFSCQGSVGRRGKRFSLY